MTDRAIDPTPVELARSAIVKALRCIPMHTHPAAHRLAKAIENDDPATRPAIHSLAAALRERG